MIYFEDVKIVTTSDSYINNTSEQYQNLQKNVFFREVYGTDLSMMGTSELLFVDGVDGEDLLLTSGISNLAQAIHHRLTTTRGAVPEDPSIGVPWNDFIGKTYSNKDFVYAELADTLMEEILKDNRVSSVDNIELNFVTQNQIDVKIEVSAVGGDTFNLGFKAQNS